MLKAPLTKEDQDDYKILEEAEKWLIRVYNLERTPSEARDNILKSIKNIQGIVSTMLEKYKKTDKMADKMSDLCQ